MASLGPLLDPFTASKFRLLLLVGLMALPSTAVLAQTTGPTPTPATAAGPATAQRIDPIIAPVKRAAPAKTKIDPALAASIKTKAGQLATAVKAVPKQDAIAAAKAALASAKAAMAKALAAKKAEKTTKAAAAKVPVKTAAKAAPAKPVTSKPVATSPSAAAAPAQPAGSAPAAKPL
jgi:hypothetical protein